MLSVPLTDQPTLDSHHAAMTRAEAGRATDCACVDETSRESRASERPERYATYFNIIHSIHDIGHIPISSYLQLYYRYTAS